MTMRKLWVVDHPYPPTAEDISAAAASGAAEIVCSPIPPRLAAQGVGTAGYHEIETSAPRRLIAKPLVHQRVAALGKIAAVYAVLQADADAFGRWLMPGYTAVYADDPDLLTILAAAGLSEAEIAAVTA